MSGIGDTLSKAKSAITDQIYTYTENYTKTVGIALFAISLFSFAMMCHFIEPTMWTVSTPLLGGGLVLGLIGYKVKQWFDNRNDPNQPKTKAQQAADMVLILAGALLISGLIAMLQSQGASFFDKGAGVPSLMVYMASEGVGAIGAALLLRCLIRKIAQWLNKGQPINETSGSPKTWAKVAMVVGLLGFIASTAWTIQLKVEQGDRFGVLLASVGASMFFGTFLTGVIARCQQESKKKQSAAISSDLTSRTRANSLRRLARTSI